MENSESRSRSSQQQSANVCMPLDGQVELAQAVTSQ
jgi:hypothetical protein